MQQRTSDWCLFIFLSPRSDCCSCDWLRPAFSVRSRESRPAWKTVTPSDQTWGFGDKNAGAAELRVPEAFLAARRPTAAHSLWTLPARSHSETTLECLIIIAESRKTLLAAGPTSAGPWSFLWLQVYVMRNWVWPSFFRIQFTSCLPEWKSVNV